jgi:hypothetical protein
MTSDKLKDVMRAQPFRPFVLHLADGRRINVSHPESISLSGTGRTAHVFGSDEASHFIDVLMVTDLEVKARQSRNGHRR